MDSRKKRSEVLGMITANGFTIAVAGTHGKTTTSSMIAHLLKSSGADALLSLAGFQKIIVPTSLPKKSSEKKIFVLKR